MEFEIPVSVMEYVMPAFDTAASFLMFYMALQLTKDFGFGNKREWLLFGHRLLMFMCSFAFAYHAYDIWREPHRHGLTGSNFLLHVTLLSVSVFSAVRLTIAEKPNYEGGNGGGFIGPFGRHRNPPGGGDSLRQERKPASMS